MITLDYYKKTGLKITWKLIAAGLNGIDNIPPQMIWEDVTDYLLETIGDSSSELMNAFDIYLEKDDYDYAESMIMELAETENSSVSLQKQKIIIAMLSDFIDRSGMYENTDDIIGLELEFLELMEMISPNHISNDLLPSTINNQDIRRCFTWRNFYKQKEFCKAWIETKIDAIREIEGTVKK
ncbi:MAG: hypothetical protein IJK86_05965 [Lachnospiraceae bacterium]|nr:hypothetical protein [Lachnospiraceae bacterium]